VLYAQDLPRKAWFSAYAETFDTVEINNTFYRLPEPETFESWRERAPAGFIYALKFSRYGSHLRRLKDAENTIGLFLERASRLQDCLGPILVQLPPRWHANPQRLDHFLGETSREFRWAIEFRDRDWLKPEIFALLHKHGAALCIHDLLENHPGQVTADWVYLRFHGSRDGGSYSHQFLTGQARRIRGWLGRGLDVFAYFNNDAGGHAVTNARDLKRYLRL
jgi:uncharacterized protein YecE (DUF72 family)